MKTTSITNETLYMHPDDQFANGVLVELIPDISFRTYLERPVINGHPTQVVEVTREEMETILNNRSQMKLQVKLFVELPGEEMLRPVEMSIASAGISIREALDREIQKHFIVLKLLKTASPVRRSQLPRGRVAHA